MVLHKSAPDSGVSSVSAFVDSGALLADGDSAYLVAEKCRSLVVCVKCQLYLHGGGWGDDPIVSIAR
eukprot:9892799-Lingulodinium_polyedra.AAC.1